MTMTHARAVRILGTGAFLPEQVVPSEAFDARWGKPAGWTARHVGVSRRHVASAVETSSHMGALAAMRALEAAGLEPGGLDCIISACSLMEQAIPCLGAQIQQRVGLGDSGIPAFDINATCLSFLAAFDLASTAIACGRFTHVLIVSSEVPSLGINPSDPSTAALFGDGAAAVVLGPARGQETSAVLATRMATFGSGEAHCRLRAGGTRLRPDPDPEAFAAGARFEMDGKAVYRMAARLFPEFLHRLLSSWGGQREALDWVIPHQASGKALDHLRRLLDIPADRLVRTLEHQGNQVAASIPSALHHAVASGQLQRGQLLAMLGTGAGFSMGGIILRY